MISSEFLAPAYRLLSVRESQELQKLYTNFVQKNAVLNLSAIRDEKGIWEKHLYDSLLGAEFLENAGGKVLDLGSGGGFPALPLAIVFPKKQFFPLDSVAKKMKAVAEIAVQSGIRNVTPLTGRAEELGHDPQYRSEFDVITVRAFAAFSVCLELALPFVKKDGILLLYRGPEQEESAELLIQAFGGELKQKKKTTLPSGDRREVWLIQKKQEAPKHLPRANGIPKKTPLKLSDFL